MMPSTYREHRDEKSILFLSLCVGWSPAVIMISGQLKDACASSTSAQGCFYETLIESCFFLGFVLSFYSFSLWTAEGQCCNWAGDIIISTGSLSYALLLQYLSICTLGDHRPAVHEVNNKKNRDYYRNNN